MEADSGSGLLSCLKFPFKLWRLVNDCQSEAISWGPFGKTVLIDFYRFQTEYLDRPDPLFKTKNMTSFIRQLNMYGFRKLLSRRVVYVNSTSSFAAVHEFCNDNFRLGRPDLLINVKRRTLPVKLNKYGYQKETEISNHRRSFEQILMSSAELLDFWNVSAETSQTGENGEVVVKPVYQIQAIPALKTTINDDGTVTAVLPIKPYHDRLINFDAPQCVENPDETQSKPVDLGENSKSQPAIENIPSSPGATFPESKREEYKLEPLVSSELPLKEEPKNSCADSAVTEKGFNASEASVNVVGLIDDDFYFSLANSLCRL